MKSLSLNFLSCSFSVHYFLLFICLGYIWIFFVVYFPKTVCSFFSLNSYFPQGASQYAPPKNLFSKMMYFIGLNKCHQKLIYFISFVCVYDSIYFIMFVYDSIYFIVFIYALIHLFISFLHRVRLNKRRQKPGSERTNSRLVVTHRALTGHEHNTHRHRWLFKWWFCFILKCIHFFCRQY